MEDIAPKLKENIMSDFENELKKDKFIQQVIKNADDGKATSEQASMYARRVGECASRSLKKNITEQSLPDGKLYWNIAEKAIKPLFVKCHKMINEMGIKIMKIEDAKAGLHINPTEAPFPEERVNALLDKMSDVTLQ